jgi:hypothetical protein
MVEASGTSENLIDGILEDIEADFRQGDGNELGGKFRAALVFCPSR